MRRLIIPLVVFVFTVLNNVVLCDSNPPPKEIIVGMVLVPKGWFWMGSPPGLGFSSEHPRHKVWVNGFLIDKRLVTYSEFDRFCDKTGRARPVDNGWGKGDRPALVSWEDAIAYARWAGKRLPTEAEWEKAVRAGTKTKYFFGNSDKDLGEYAWYDKNSENMSHPIGLKKPNPFGLYDSLGNVWEWCSDWYDDNYYKNSPNKNPLGPVNPIGDNSKSEKLKVIRGGSWLNNSDCASSAHRDRLPNRPSNLAGFRCVKDY